MPESNDNLRNALVKGLRKGLRGYIWLLKILLPVSLATTLIDYSGWLHQLNFLLKPVMEVVSLPPAAALPILIGLTAGIYGCLAAMAVLPLSVEHMTLITVFVLIAHNLPQEGIIQAKSGINFVKTTLVRLAAAVLTCLAVAWWLQPAPADAAAASAGLRELSSVWPFLQDWLGGMLRLCAKILVIVTGVMTLIENGLKKEEYMPKEGSKASAFCLPSADKDKVCLKDFSGKWVALYFYPKDSTSG